MPKTLLHATDISHSFDIELYSDIELQLDSSRSIAILGRSGSGKSTLLHHFSTFLKPLKGRVYLMDRDIYTLTDLQIERLRRYDLGIIFQFHYLFKGMSALQNIEVSTLLSDQSVDDTILKRFGISHLMSHKVSELSGGEQQRVSIARVLSKRPKIIFADEPTGNLDKETAHLVMDVLLEYIEESEAALLLVTHDEEMADRCSSIYRLEDKRLDLVR